MSQAPGGFVPPPYPHDRLDALHRLADAVPGGVVNCSIGNPVDPIPEVALHALTRTAPDSTSYPPSIGTLELREAAADWLDRRFGVAIDPATELVATVGTKEFVASLPHYLRLRDPSRDTVLYPAISYPTYAMGAELAGLRAVGVPLDDEWRLDLSRVSDADAGRALLLWTNDPGNPTSAVSGGPRTEAQVAWARERGVIVAADECYAEFAGDASPPATALMSGLDGVIACHSLSKRSNMAGLRVGFVAGDAALVGYLGATRKHAGMIVATPVQAAAAAALGDDEHVAAQRDRYEQRRTLVLDGLRELGLVHDGGPGLFYLWLRASESADDGWELAARLAEAGTLVAPGSLYGAAGADHVRLALTQPNDRLELALERLAAASRP